MSSGIVMLAAGAREPAEVERLGTRLLRPSPDLEFSSSVFASRSEKEVTLRGERGSGAWVYGHAFSPLDFSTASERAHLDATILGIDTIEAREGVNRCTS